jgi:response regulator RpfG family c-di-GMP phosphodiesterase
LEPGASAGTPERRSHPVLGAARLAATPGAPPVAILVAYEHHLRFDGVANYPLLPEARLPSAAARVVAVADSWDTLRSRGRLPAAEAARLLRERAGSYLDPALVETFLALLPGGEG